MPDTWRTTLILKTRLIKSREVVSKIFGNLGLKLLQNDDASVENVAKRSPVTGMRICEVIYKPD